MGFAGSLDSISFTDILNTLCKINKEGTLIVEDEKKKKIIHFQNNGVTLIGGTQNDFVGEILVQEGKLQAWELENALKEQVQTGQSLEVILLEQGLVSEEDVESIICDHIEDEICDIFFWQHANFQFIDGPPPEELVKTGEQVTLTFDVQSLLFSIAEQVEEWELIRQNVPSLSMIFVSRNDAAWDSNENELREAFEQVRGLLNGSNDVNDIIRITQLSVLIVCRMLSLMLEEGLIEPARYENLMAGADEAQSKGQTKKQIRLLEAALQTRKNEDLLLKLARAYENVNNSKSAAKYYCDLGDIFFQDNAEKATKYFEMAISHTPSNLLPREKLLSLVNNLGDEEKEVYYGSMLSKVYLQEGLTEKALDLCHSFIQRNLDNGSFRQTLINTYVEQNNLDKAVEEFEEFFAREKRIKKLVDYLPILDNIVKQEPERLDVKKHLKNIRRAILWQEKRHVIYSSIVAGVVLLVVFIYAARYEFLARSHYQSAKRYQSVSKFQEAKLDCNTVIEKYSLSTVVDDAKAIIAAIQRSEQAAAARLQKLWQDQGKKIELKFEAIRFKVKEKKYKESRILLKTYAREYRGPRYAKFRSQIDKIVLKLGKYIQEEEQKQRKEKLEKMYNQALKYFKNDEYPKSLKLWNELKKFPVYKDKAIAKIKQIEEDLAASELRKIKRKVDEAEKLEREGYYDEAMREYKSIETELSDIGSNKNLNKSDRRSILEYSTSVQGGISRIDGWESKAELEIQETEKLKELGDPKQAYKTIKRLLADPKLSKTKAARKAKLPIKITSNPPKAKILGTDLKTPCYYELNPTQKIEVTIAKKSFTSVKITIDAVLGKSFHHVVLKKKRQWKTDAKGILWHAPVAYKDNLVIPTLRGQVVALKRDSGKIQWIGKTQGINQIRGGIAKFAGNFYVASNKGMYAFRSNGDKYWNFTNTKGAIWVAPIAEEEGVFFGTTRGIFYCLNSRNGREIWSYDAKDKITSSPILWETSIIFGTARGYLIALDIARGRKRWKIQIPEKNIKNHISASGDNLFLSSQIGSTSVIHCYSLGKKLRHVWEKQLSEKGTIQGKIVAFANRVYAVTMLGYIYSLNRSNGRTIWKQQIDNGIISTPTISPTKGLLYVGDNKGIVYAIHAKTKNIVWQEQISQKIIRSDLLIYNKVLFVGSEDRHLYAVSE